MNRILKTTLLAVARLGVFLSILTWGVGQRRAAWIHVPGLVSLELRQTSVTAIRWPVRNINRHAGLEPQFDHTELTGHMIGKPETRWIVPGIRIVFGSRGCADFVHALADCGILYHCAVLPQMVLPYESDRR